MLPGDDSRNCFCCFNSHIVFVQTTVNTANSVLKIALWSERMSFTTTRAISNKLGAVVRRSWSGGGSAHTKTAICCALGIVTVDPTLRRLNSITIDSA